MQEFFMFKNKFTGGNRQMFKRFFKKTVALIIAVVTVISLFPASTAFAATGDVGTISFTLTHDSSGNAMRYNSSAVINGYTAGGAGNYKYRMYVDGDTAFCIQPGVPLHTGDKLKESSSATWNALSANQKKAVGLALLYGYQGNKSNLTGSDDEKWVATQTLVWEFVTGRRNPTGSYTQTGTDVYQLHFGSNYANSGAKAAYDQIVAMLKEHNTIPSFMSESKTGITKELSYSGGKYTITLTDSNGVLSDYTFSSSDNNVSVSKSGNKLTISSTTAISGSARITATRNNVPTVSQSAKMLAYGDDSLQDVVTGVENSDSVAAYINIETPTGTLALKKTSEDGVVAGIKFTITGNNYEKTVTTGSDGTISVEGMFPGTYTITEASYDRYVPQSSKTVTIIGGQTSTVSFSNILKKFRVTVTKSDVEAGTPQGNASLAGATYGIYNGGELVDTYVTDVNGKFTTKYYICGDNWTIKEIQPSEGYLLDGTTHKVGEEAKLYTVEYNSTSNAVTEQVIKGKIAIIKHTDDGSTQIETPEKGAEFEVYLKSAGSYQKAKEPERDILTCDENGFAQTKDLPYGVYTVYQTKGWDGRELIADFDVFICSNGETYRYLINNANFESYIKVVKVDAETGKTIPYAGAGFQIYRPDGSLVTQTFTYPTVTTIDTFYTNDEGYLVTPEKLEYGKGYSLVEVQAPYGYVLDSTPIKFDVVQENSNDENGITVIKVERPNMAQKGVIIIEKTGEIFSTVTGKGFYQPVYEVQGLPGAVYDIIAAEDIVTPDGTVRTKKDEVVDTITTDDTGTAKSHELYLGRYSVVERTAPYGMVLNEEVHEVELTYAGQEISVTETATSFYNERQRVEISLDKSLEQDEQFGIGMNGEIFDVTFGLFATEDITAADGSVIPADGLIEIISLNENGHGVCQTDLPFGSFYLKELSTNAAYRPSDTQYPVVFEYAGQDTALVKLTANDGKAIENKLLRGSLKVIKTFEGRETPIAGVPFTITGVTVTGIEIVINAVTDENGEILLENLPIGEFVVKELESELTAGYVLSPEQTAVVAADEIAEMTIDNKLMRGDLKIIKTFEGKSVPIAGVKFTVTGKTLTGEDYNGEFETDEDGCIIIEGLLAGDYKVKEVASDLTVGYVLSEEQAAVVAHEQVTELQIENKLIRGNVKLIKTDKDGGAKLAGAVFDLYDPDGNLISSYTTDKNGEIFIENLPYGFGYKLVESKAPEGYKLEKTEISFDITENGTTVELSATNEKIPTPDNPKTGDDSNVGLWIALAGISAAALIGLGVASKRRKKKIEETEE